jgi:hypothetical protein
LELNLQLAFGSALELDEHLQLLGQQDLLTPNLDIACQEKMGKHLRNLSNPSDVKFVAIIPDPTIAKPNKAVPRNSIPTAR